MPTTNPYEIARQKQVSDALAETAALVDAIVTDTDSGVEELQDAYTALEKERDELRNQLAQAISDRDNWKEIFETFARDHEALRSHVAAENAAVARSFDGVNGPVDDNLIDAHSI